MAWTLSRRALLASALAIALAPTARADVKPHALFSDHSVLQRGKPVPVWGTASPNEQIKVTLSAATPVSATATADDKGNWKATLPTLEAGGPYTLTIAGQNSVVKLNDVLVGEVWICSGQSNMEWSLRNTFEPEKVLPNAKHPMVRLFTVPKAISDKPLKTVKSEWKECTPETAPSFSAVGYFFGRDLQKALGVPVGLIHTSWGGTPAEAWTSHEGLMAHGDLKSMAEKADKIAGDYAANKEKIEAKYQDDMAKYKDAVVKAKAEGKTPPRAPQKPDPLGNQNTPSRLYNAMLAPLVPYSVAGAIWYQGESNSGRAYEYRTLFPAMIADWRKQFGQGDFPFIAVQLAPFMAITDKPGDSAWAELREAQLLATTKLPKVGMAVITDVGEEKDIHPRKKEPVGARLALAARAIAYGEKIEGSGPVYKSMKVEGNRAVLSFDHVGAGLEAHGGALTGFAICGEDKKWVNAQAEIRGDNVVVSAAGVEKPVAVRFGWANFPVVNLWNKDGLPATPFRTDDFPMVTNPKK